MNLLITATSNFTVGSLTFFGVLKTKYWWEQLGSNQ